ncbi:MAG: hypothetical protein ACE5HY_02995 [Candidatus Hydrothermarchaeales archaeon]
MRLVLVFVITILMAAGVGALLTTLKYGSEAKEIGKELDITQGELAQAKSNLEQAKSGKKLECVICHELDQLKGFHYPSRILAIQEKENKPRRICIDCHATPAALEKTTVDVNGIFDIPVEMPHEIHKARLDSGSMKCETCHVVGDEFLIPQPRKGEVLVCELCHTSGNFIKIHIEGRILEDNPNMPQKQYPKLGCNICHPQTPVDIHKAATSVLGQAEAHIH